MGKKANKRRQKQTNSRGYATTNTLGSQKGAKNTTLATTKPQIGVATSSSLTPSSRTKTSSETHQDLLHLLGILSDENGLSRSEPTSTWISPDRFYKKLYNIHDSLNQLGFNYESIQRVVVALGYDITLETALDWLCLHCSAQNLPPLLTEGTVREQEMQESGTSSSLQVLKPSPARTSDVSGTTLAKTTTPLVPPVSEELNADASTNYDNVDRSNAKAWILHQYQYEDDNNEVDKDARQTNIDDTLNKRPQETQQEPSESQVISLDEQYVDPDQIRLTEMERQLREQEADLNDDANNYMRSKQEINLLKVEVKKLRQKVQGLRRKVEQKAKAREADAAASGDGNDDNEEDYTGGFFGAINNDEIEEGGEEGVFSSFFDQTSAKATTTDTAPEKEPQDLPPPSDPIVPKGSIDAGWTGKTPKQVLEDWCKKEKKRQPRFFKLSSQNGAKIKVDSFVLKTDNYMGSYLDAQQYLSTKTLYKLNPELPLYRLFPPYYRDIWKKWSQSVQDEKEASKTQQEEELRSKIQKLVDSVPKPKQPNKSKAATKDAKSKPEVIVQDCWEDNEDDDGLGDWEEIDRDPPLEESFEELEILASPTSTESGNAIKVEFQQRQNTSKYQAMLKSRMSLPMYSFRRELLQTIKTNQVTILCAETGAGKTTQCPQYLLEEAFLQGRGDKISVLVSQPRRVACTSVAERVSDEMAESRLGETVGYSIRLENKRSSKTKLLFCTTGVILRRLQEDPLLEGITHVCVDEVHERQYQVDCLLVILRQLLRTGRPDLKVILMSATLDSRLFCSFFGGAPVVNVPGRTFPVATYYLEDLLEGTDHIIEEGSRYALRDDNGGGQTASVFISTRGGEKRKEVHNLDNGGVHLADVSDDYPGYKMATRRSMDRVNEEVINYDLIEDVLTMILVEAERNEILLPPDGVSLSDGSVLVFLPGFGEIRSLTERLEGSRTLGNRQHFDVIPMHSTLSPQDQRRAFLRPKKGCRKIILATNIAETSVTIPDVVCVIDAGRVREVRVDKRTSTSRLVTDWCSRASVKQRAGRAGRLQPGICLKLFSSLTEKHKMQEAAQPEIRRVPLEDVCLSILAGSFADNCMDFLIQTPQPPSEEAVTSALRNLRDVGAIRLVENSNISRKSIPSEQLTALGRHLAKLPVDARLGKMLIFGALFKCIDPVVTVAATLSCKSPFSSFVNDALQAKAKHKLFVHEQSDFLTLCNVWDAYDKASSSGTATARNFCYDNYLSFSAMREIADTRRHFVDLLVGIGFISKSQLARENQKSTGGRGNQAQVLSSSSYNSNRQNLDVVHSVICAGLYPNVGHLVPNESGSGERQLWHRKERLYFHSASVNSNLKGTGRYPTSWIAFHEKFGTQHRVSVATTCFVNPHSILVFGGTLEVKHTERRVIVDGWISLDMAAQTGVMFRELRKQVDRLLQDFLHLRHHELSTTQESEARHKAMVDGIVKLVSTTANS